MVVDEVVGMWTSLLFLPFTPATAVAGFVLFRIMDVFKPYPARQFESLPGGWGIMSRRPHGRRSTRTCSCGPAASPWAFEGTGQEVMRAEILAVGSELLTPLRSDTNALYLTAKLLEIGIDTGARVTVADDAGLLESAFRTALGRAEIVIATGGLGPTEDDLTREAAAAALGRPLHRDPALIEELKARFARFGRVMAPVNEKQADVIEGATVLRNPRGHRARAARRRRRAHARPPSRPAPRDAADVRAAGPARPPASGPAAARLRTRILKIAAMGESDVEQVVAPVYKTFTNPRTTILGGPGQVELHLTAEGATAEAAEAHIEALAVPLRERAGRTHLQRRRPRAAGGGGRHAPGARGSPWPSPNPARAACSRARLTERPGRARTSIAPG